MTRTNYSTDSSTDSNSERKTGANAPHGGQSHNAVIIAGSRGFGGANERSFRVDYVDLVLDEAGFEVDEVVSGTARGADQAGEEWADANDVPVSRFPADWDEHGKRAGPKRNEEMAEYADQLVAIWDGSSSGTRNMIQQGRAILGDENVHVHNFRDDPVDVNDDDEDDDEDELPDMDDIEQLHEVGGVTAYRLDRDLNITTVGEVADADVETLQEVWGVGEHRAGRMKGHAQGLRNKRQAAMDEQWESRGHNERRVAVVAGQDELDQLSPDYADTVVGLALAEADVPLEEHTRLGFVNTNAKSNEMGGATISDWYDRKVATGEMPRKAEFATPWTKYAYFLWDEWGYDEQPTMPRPKLKTQIPFDVSRGSDVEAWMAPAERTRNMVKWADEVVIVADGEYADSFRKKCKRLDVDCTTVFEIDDGEVTTYDEPDQVEIDAFEPDEEQTYHGGDGPRAGSVPDLEDDEHLTMAPSDSLDQRPEVDDETAGGGVGSATYDELISPGR